MKKERTVTFLGNPMTLEGTQTQVSETAPDFTAVRKDLSPAHLHDFKDKIKVISVFPSIDTGVCALQTKRFNTIAAQHPEAVVLAISNDLPFAQSRFCGAEGIENLITLSDQKDREFGMKYGFYMKELGLLARGVVVIDKNNKVQYVEYVPEVSHEPNYDQALAILKSL